MYIYIDIQLQSNTIKYIIHFAVQPKQEQLVETIYSERDHSQNLFGRKNPVKPYTRTITKWVYTKFDVLKFQTNRKV